MEKADVLGSSTAPLTWHDFLERMRHPSAADFVKSIKSFIVSFSNNAPDSEKDSAAVQDFLAKMEAAFRVHSLWAGCSEEELESAGEGLEKYVMTKLYTRVFASLPEDVQFDEQLSQKMALVQQFVQPENLDIKPTFQNETSWLLAQKELQKINMYKAPRDKLVCILNCCKIINNLLLNASIASNENPPGADEFLPVLIYVTIKANPPQLHSNLQYIQRYRRETRLVSEAAYFFTNILSAESFISNIDAKSLSMDESEFERNMDTARALLLGLASDLEDTRNQGERYGYGPRRESIKSKLQLNAKNERDNMPSTKGHSSQANNSDSDAEVNYAFSMMKNLSISDLEKKGATELLTENQLSNIFREYPYLYAHMDDLTVNDVEDLLNSYKQLVFKYVCLSKGMGVASHSLPLPVLQTHKHTNNETGKESEDTSAAAEVSDDKCEDVDKTHETLDGDSLHQLENSELKMPQDDSLPTLEKV